MTLEQLRVSVSAGGVTGITLKGQDGGFLVEIATRSGQGAFLAKRLKVLSRACLAA